MPFFNPTGVVLLDVILRRDGLVKRWTINTGDLPDYWSCRLLDANSVTVSACFTEAAVTARVREWEAQIDAARADGWA